MARSHRLQFGLLDAFAAFFVAAIACSVFGLGTKALFAIPFVFPLVALGVDNMRRASREPDRFEKWVLVVCGLTYTALAALVVGGWSGVFGR